MNQNFINSFVQKVTQKDFWEAFNLSKIPQKFKSLGRAKKNRQISLETYNQIISLFLIFTTMKYIFYQNSLISFWVE